MPPYLERQLHASFSSGTDIVEVFLSPSFWLLRDVVAGDSEAVGGVGDTVFGADGGSGGKLSWPGDAASLTPVAGLGSSPVLSFSGSGGVLRGVPSEHVGGDDCLTGGPGDLCITAGCFSPPPCFSLMAP